MKTIQILWAKSHKQIRLEYSWRERVGMIWFSGEETLPFWQGFLFSVSSGFRTGWRKNNSRLFAYTSCNCFLWVSKTCLRKWWRWYFGQGYCCGHIGRFVGTRVRIIPEFVVRIIPVVKWIFMTGKNLLLLNKSGINQTKITWKTKKQKKLHFLKEWL